MNHADDLFTSAVAERLADAAVVPAGGDAAAGLARGASRVPGPARHVDRDLAGKAGHRDGSLTGRLADLLDVDA